MNVVHWCFQNGQLQTVEAKNKKNLENGQKIDNKPFNRADSFGSDFEEDPFFDDDPLPSPERTQSLSSSR